MGCVCRLCGRGATEIEGYLARVNQKGVPGIWECRPDCNAKLSPDEALLLAIKSCHKDSPDTKEQS